MPLTNPLRTTSLCLLCACGCVDGAPWAIAPLPAAVLTCPAEVEAGAPFVVDGSDTRGDVAEATLSVGAQQASGVRDTFVVDTPGVVTARLVVTDDDGNTAEARCRIVVRGALDPAGGDGGVPDPPLDVDLSGRFALVAYDRPSLHDDSLEPPDQLADAPVLALVDLEQDGTAIHLEWQYCAIVWPQVEAWFGTQTTTWSSECVAAMPPLVADLALDGTSFAPPIAGALGQSTVVGARVGDDEPLPVSTDSPALVDDDGDGWPAVTVRSSTYAQDIVYRRAVRELAGTVLDADTIEGSYRADAEATVVSWRDFMVPAGPGRPSAFRLSRIDADTDCAGLRARADELLASFPPPSD